MEQMTNVSMRHAIPDLAMLGSVEDVKRNSQALAILDAVLMPEWQYRYFLFNSRWDQSAGEMMASMRSGSGDEYFILFAPSGAIGKAAVLEDLVDNPATISTRIPQCFGSFTSEPAFRLSSVSYCFWCISPGSVWRSEPAERKTFPLLQFLVGGPEYYLKWARQYYETDIDIGAVTHVFAELSVDEGVLMALNQDVVLESLHEDLHEIIGGP